MSQNKTKFDLWWNSYPTKRVVGAAYSLGAAVVILGAMFKILHLEYAGVMLGVGMSFEAALFALGVFDKPYREYEWNKVFDFDSNQALNINSVSGMGSSTVGSVSPQSIPSVNFGGALLEEDVKKLSDGIKNLSTTAQQLASLSNVANSTDNFIKNLDAASNVTSKFVESQQILANASSKLQVSYQGIVDGMHVVEGNTKTIGAKIDDINKNLSSINSIYEIQLKNIQTQSEGLAHQTESVNAVTRDLIAMSTEIEKMKVASVGASQQTETFKLGTEKLSKHVADLNVVYGNMLNALS